MSEAKRNREWWIAHFAEGREKKRQHEEMLASLPPFVEGMEVRCPTHNRDGSPIQIDDVCGCGSLNVVWDGEVYDCLDCGIYFAPWGAMPPHRRGRD